jgi:excisionase family DNA binding protein
MADDGPDEVTLIDPGWWWAHNEELSEALWEATDDAYKQGVYQALTGTAAEGPDESEYVAPSPKPDEERLCWSVEECATALGISRALAYDAVRAGQIPSIRIGRRVLVPKAALDDLLQAARGLSDP